MTIKTCFHNTSGEENNKENNNEDLNRKTNKTTVSEASGPQCQAASMWRDRSWAGHPYCSPLLWGKRVTHISRVCLEEKNAAKVHVQGHNDKGCRLVHCVQRTIFTTTASLFVEWLQVSSVENVHLTKNMKKNKCHPVFIHFVSRHSGKNTEMCLPWAVTLVMMRLWWYTCGFGCVCMKTYQLKDRMLCFMCDRQVVAVQRNRVASLCLPKS